MAASGGDLSWYFSQVKGTLDDDVAEGNLDTHFIAPFYHSYNYSRLTKKPTVIKMRPFDHSTVILISVIKLF